MVSTKRVAEGIIGEEMAPFATRKIKLFMDGADIESMKEMYRQGMVKGFTTNPTLMRKAGVSDYEAFAAEALRAIPDLPISFEVFSDEFDEMERQARKISAWGNNVYVKIPITNTEGNSIVSVFAGRIADTGRDPMPLMKEASILLQGSRQAELLWASPRELLNIFQAEECGCHIITAVSDILKKLPLIGNRSMSSR